MATITKRKNKKDFEFDNHVIVLQQWILKSKIFSDNYCNNNDRILRFVSGLIRKDSSFQMQNILSHLQ